MIVLTAVNVALFAIGSQTMLLFSATVPYFAAVIGILIFAVFAVIVITIFNSVSNNPIDNLSITYIRNSTDIQNEYGEIISIGKNILYKTKNDESTIKTPYTIETETGRVIVYVTLMKWNEEWTASSLEVIEVIPNE